jgi:hypothetical protein
MRPEEYDIYHFLNRTPGEFVSVYDVAKHVGAHRTFSVNRTWAEDSLKRLEFEGLAESNQNGDYRLRHQPDDTTAFLRALEKPGVDLGDTAIITIQDVEQTPLKSPTSH